MSDEVVSPPVRTLDFGYAAPNPIQYGQLALAQTQPVQEAVQNSMAARNQFLIQQINAEKAMQLAQWQHGAQIQREQLRDQRMLQVAKMRAQAQLDALKEKGALDDIKAKNQYLSRIGGGSLARQDGESDTAYGQRLDSAIKGRMESNIATDSKAAYGIQKQITAYNNYLNDPRVSSAAANELQSAAANPGVRAQAQNTVSTGFNAWLDKVAGDNAPMIQEALQKAGPQYRDTVLKNAGLKDAYDAYQGAALQQSAYAYLKAAGSPAAKQMAAANENLGILKQQLQDISMMPGDNGRMVPKSWWPEVQNTTDQMFLHDRLTAPPTVAPAAAPPAPAAAAPVQPVVAPRINDPYAAYRGSDGSMILPGTPAGAQAANPPAPANPNPVTPLSPADAARWGIQLPALPAPAAAPAPTNALFYPNFSDGTPSRIPFVFPSSSAPMASPGGMPVMAPGGSLAPMPALPQLQPIPSAVAVQAPIPSNPVVVPMTEDATGPYDQAMQMMQMRNLYSQ